MIHLIKQKTSKGNALQHTDAENCSIGELSKELENFKGCTTSESTINTSSSQEDEEIAISCTISKPNYFNPSVITKQELSNKTLSKKYGIVAALCDVIVIDCIVWSCCVFVYD